MNQQHLHTAEDGITRCWWCSDDPEYINYHDLEWGMNPTGLKFLLNYSGNIPGIPSLKIQEKPSFADYKRTAITAFLSKASARIKAYQPNCIISAAVKPNLNNATNTFGQEWDVWLAGGYIDWAVPMNYTKNVLMKLKNIIMKYLTIFFFNSLFSFEQRSLILLWNLIMQFFLATNFWKTQMRLLSLITKPYTTFPTTYMFFL